MLRRRLFFTLYAAATLSASAQQTVVVADATTREPVGHASLYTKEGGRFRAAITDGQGRATIGFDFHRLTASHLSYEQLTVRQSSLPDTLFLRPRFRATAEVVVTSQEPPWIRQKLRQIVAEKGQRYFGRTATEHFDYHTQSLGTTRLYRYHLSGLMQMADATHQRYAILVDSSAIVASDTTRLTDVANLERMLYEDFVAELDNGFVRSHRWYVNTDYEGRSPDEVELLFRSRHRTDDRGRVLIDTARCVILRASRQTGTKSNMHDRMPRMLYVMAGAISGYKVQNWVRDYRVTYAERADGTCYPQEVRYKLYYDCQDGSVDKHEQEYHEKTGGGFPNMEAVLTLQPATVLPAAPVWRELPHSWYLRLSSDAARQRDIDLAGLPATFTLYEADE